MKNNSNLYNYKTPKEGYDEINILLPLGRITKKDFFLRILISIGVYFISFCIYNFNHLDNYKTGLLERKLELKDFSFLTSFTIFHLIILPAVLIIFILTQGAKRMHDINRSGWYFLIPFYNIILSFQNGTNGKNSYGIDPKPPVIRFFDQIQDDIKNTALNSIQSEDKIKNNISFHIFKAYLLPTFLGFILIVILGYFIIFMRDANSSINNKVQDSLNKIEKIESNIFITWADSISGKYLDQRDNQIYKVAKVGDQVWMTNNLNTTKFLNGDLIPEAKSNFEWVKAGKSGKPAWCYFDNNPQNGSKFGKLYNWYAVNDSRGLAPKGWHIPKDSEWQIMVNHYGGFPITHKKLKDSNKWNATLSGVRCGIVINFCEGDFMYGTGNEGFWWSSEKYDAQNAFVFDLNYIETTKAISFSNFGYGCSVRCIKD